MTWTFGSRHQMVTQLAGVEGRTLRPEGPWTLIIYRIQIRMGAVSSRTLSFLMVQLVSTHFLSTITVPLMFQTKVGVYPYTMVRIKWILSKALPLRTEKIHRRSHSTILRELDKRLSPCVSMWFRVKLSHGCSEILKSSALPCVEGFSGFTIFPLPRISIV